jgi:23S rRNA pseudouridine1911/1915/1917 synthase
MEILYEDNHLFIVNKPAGLLTQPTKQVQDSLETRAKQWIKVASNKPGNVFLHAIHRLDRPVSGIVAFAKTTKALERLNEAIREKETVKHYLAWVEGAPSNNVGVLEHPLIHNDYRASVHPSGKLARLTYRILEKKPRTCLVEIFLETGRYHQIRAQLAAIGCPIIGDAKYGSRTPFYEEAIALHHDKLAFFHPTTKELMEIKAPLPPYWVSITPLPS